MEIRWKKGYHSKTDANACHGELEAIRERDGNITPEAVVAAASEMSSSMHPQFTWDDTEAAKQYRLNEARHLGRSIELVVSESPNTPVRAYSLVSAPPAEGESAARKVYTSTTEALADPVVRDEILSAAVRDALTFRKRYHALSELSSVFQSMDSFLQEANV